MKSEIKPTVINERDSAESSNPRQEFPQPRRLARRSFLRNLGMGAALLAPGAALLGTASKALAANGRQRLNAGDVAILQLLADGMSNADVAAKLFISAETVKSHGRHILTKLEADTRTHAVAIALRDAIID